MEKEKIKASIISEFYFGQTVYFISETEPQGHAIISGTVVSISGEIDTRIAKVDILLGIELTSGEYACIIRVKEQNCFESKEQLVENLLLRTENI